MHEEHSANDTSIHGPIGRHCGCCDTHLRDHNLQFASREVFLRSGYLSMVRPSQEPRVAGKGLLLEDALELNQRCQRPIVCILYLQHSGISISGPVGHCGCCDGELRDCDLQLASREVFLRSENLSMVRPSQEPRAAGKGLALEDAEGNSTHAPPCGLRGSDPLQGAGSDAGALVPERGDLEHEPPGALAVARLREVEQDGVQEAVGAGERPRALVDDGEQVARLAGHAGQRPHHQVHRLGEVERQEADAEHRRHHHDHPHCLVPLLPGGAAAGRRAAEDERHAAVARHHAHEGQQEAEAGEHHAVRVVGHRVPGRAQVVAHRAVALRSRGGEVESGRAEDGDHEPHAAADAPRQPAAALLGPHGQRVADAHVAVHADAGEEEDAAVKIATKKSGK